MGVPIINTGPMTVEELYAFTDRAARRREMGLIDEGGPGLNAYAKSIPPVDSCGNIISLSHFRSVK